MQIIPELRIFSAPGFPEMFLSPCEPVFAWAVVDIIAKKYPCQLVQCRVTKRAPAGMEPLEVRFAHPVNSILGATARSSHRGLPFSSLPMASGNVISPFSAFLQNNNLSISSYHSFFLVFTYKFFEFHHDTKIHPDTAKKRQPGQ